MAKRPEGLSPNFNSIVSPQIPSSLIFSWVYIPENSSDSQKASELKIYKEGSNTALLTLSAGTANEIDLTSKISTLDIDSSYEWEVKVTAANNSVAYSGRKLFKYVTVFLNSNLDWPSGPDSYEYIGTRKYFEEIRENAKSLLEDYTIDSKEEENMYQKAENLFQGNIVPMRKDFIDIESILEFIAKKESSYGDEVSDLIEDGLGAEDIHKVYTFFDRLSKIPPRQPSNISLSFTSAPALAIADGSVSNDGVGDLSVDISWYPTELETGTCVVNLFDDLTEDVSYYALSLKVGFTDYSCTHHLFYRISDLDAMHREIDVPMEHINFEHLSSTKKTRYEIALTATDKRNDLSPSFSKYYFVDNLPLGVKSYQLRSQQNDLQDKAVIKPYYDIYNGTGTAYVHKVTGNVDGVYHYQVRLYDKNGNISPWFYIPDKVKLDPLKPPEPPKPYVKSTEINSIEFAWNYVKTADKYEIDPLYSSAANWITTSNTKLITGLNENTSYSVRIRATNRAGSSSWVTISGRTKARPILTYTQTSLRSRTWRTSYYILKQNGRVVRPASEYRYEMDNEEVIHGEWIELRNKIQNGIAVKKGTRWGNHKSLYFLDYSGWQSRLKGKEIIDVKFYIRRKSTPHGYPDDGRFLHVWSHNYNGASSLPSANRGPDVADHYKVEKLDWDRGEGHWVTLPKSYGEKLRDGKIKGFAFYHPTSEREPYSYMRFDADTIQFQIRYK